MKAVKENKEYTITEDQKARYLAQGFTIVDEKGNVLEGSAMSSVLRVEYEKLKQEHTELWKQYTELQEQYKMLAESISGQNSSQGQDAPEQTAPEQDTPDVKSVNSLTQMNVDELKAYALANNIDIGQATSKDGILKKIREAEKE